MNSEDVSIVRAPRTKDRPYFSMCRATAQDERLSWEARGVLAYLLSKPDDWQVQIPDLQQKCGRDKVRGILQELIDSGYLVKSQEHDPETGKFLRNHYQTYETPFTENPSTAKPSTANPPITYKRKKQSTDIHSPKPPKGASKPAKYPTVFTVAKWSNELIAQFSDEYAEGLTALIEACDMREMYPAIKNMPRRDALKYMEALLELTRLGCPHGQFHSLWIYTRTVLNWRRNAISPLDMVEQYTAWRQSRETELTAPLPLGMKEIR